MPSDFADRFPHMAAALLRVAGWRDIKWNFDYGQFLHPHWYPPENQLQSAADGIALGDAWAEYERRQELTQAGWVLRRYAGPDLWWYPPGTTSWHQTPGRSFEQALAELRRGRG